MSTTVVVIGAGAAGLSLARSLVERDGFEVVVLERRDSVGGKCRSLEYDGRKYDLGANFTTPRYQRTRALADAIGLEREPIARRRVVSVVDEPAPEAGVLAGWLLEAARLWYLTRRGWTRVDRDGFEGLGSSLGRSFADWLKVGGLGPVQEVFDSLFCAYGYGPVSSLPAAYGLKFFDAVHLGAAVKIVRGRSLATTTDFVGGFEALWTGVVDRWGLDVRLGAEVVGVERSEDEVVVRFVQDGQEQEERADHLVLACPLQGALDFLDASEDERRLFSKIEHFDYRVVCAKTRGLDDISTYLYPWSQVWTPGQPTAFYKPHPGDPNEVFLFYAYGSPELSDEEILENIRATLGREPFGAEITEVLTVQSWTYFPHVSVQEMRAGFYDHLESMQGTHRTWYVGELLSFPLVELVVRYSEQVAARIR